MKLSHSKLTCILNCPMTYYLQYKVGIFPKIEKPALAIGSAVHWGIEHNTEDLTEYYSQDFKTKDSYGHDQLLAEAMVHGYMKNNESIFDTILRDPDTGEMLKIVDEMHEVYITGKLKSYRFDEKHDFVGIIDLLLLVENSNGELFFIIIDYKTSSAIPNWDDYLEQIYRYIFLLRSTCEEIPIKKIGIINIRKTAIRQKSKETWEQYLRRLKQEYDINDDNLVNVHMYNNNELDKTIVDAYIDNLSKMADTAQLIDDNNMWFINFPAANGKYGKSQYWDIFYRTRDCYVLYNISDKIYNKNIDEFLTKRDCRPLDMNVIDRTDVLNKYDKFKTQALAFYDMNKDISKETLFVYLKKNFLTDDMLLDAYWSTLEYEISHNSESN